MRRWPKLRDVSSGIETREYSCACGKDTQTQKWRERRERRKGSCALAAGAAGRLGPEGQLELWAAWSINRLHVKSRALVFLRCTNHCLSLACKASCIGSKQYGYMLTMLDDTSYQEMVIVDAPAGERDRNEKGVKFLIFNSFSTNSRDANQPNPAICRVVFTAL